MSPNKRKCPSRNGLFEWGWLLPARSIFIARNREGMIGKPPLAMLPRAVQGPMPLAAGGAAARVRIERAFCGSHLAANMRSRGVRSPDEWDAVALTFAEPVSPPSEKILIRIPRGGHWMSR